MSTRTREAADACGGTRAAPAGPLEQALGRVRAPDVVFAVSRGGARTVATGGSTPAPPVPRTELRYELGSLSKTFTVLLLAELARAGALGLDDPLAAHLGGPLPRGARARGITLRHLATHTSGLPRVPRDLVPGALLHPYRNGYAGYGRERLLRAFARSRPRHAPGTRWHYSNLGVALLGAALENAAGEEFTALLTGRVLRPLGLRATTVGPAPGAVASAGHRGDGRTPLPPTDMAAFTPAGALLSTPSDLLRYAEAHLRPGVRQLPDGAGFGDSAGPDGGTQSDGGTLAAALYDVRLPLLRRGLGHRHTHTLAWYQHPAPGGPLLFHAGATFGHQSFLGCHPATGTAVAAVANRHDRGCALIGAAYGLLRELSAAGPA